AGARWFETDFPFGIAIQLFEPRWSATDPDDRGALLNGPAQAAGALLEGGPFEADPWPTDQGNPLILGLFWLAINLSSVATLVMLVHDAHWSFDPSLRFLIYLSVRLPHPPIVLF